MDPECEPVNGLVATVLGALCGAASTACNIRANKAVTASWSDNINKDYNGRKSKR